MYKVALILQGYPTRKHKDTLHEMWPYSPLELAIVGAGKDCQRFLSHTLVTDFVEKVTT